MSFLLVFSTPLKIFVKLRQLEKYLIKIIRVFSPASFFRFVFLFYRFNVFFFIGDAVCQTLFIRMLRVYCNRFLPFDDNPALEFDLLA